MTPVPREIEDYYLLGGEAVRPANEWGELERLRTQSILARRLPAVPAVILDVGGAAGAYAFPLAEKGYELHLLDPVDLHLEQARAYSAASGVRLGSIAKGDARSVELPRNMADAVLLLGPLYHLVERTDRREALDEARRLLNKGGVVFAVGISRFASLIDGLSRGFFEDVKFRKIVEGDLLHGLHRNPTNEPAYFTTAYFHRPEELRAELEEAGFRNVEVVAIEGPAWCTAKFREASNDVEQRRRLLEFLSAIEVEPSLQGASAHVMAIGLRAD